MAFCTNCGKELIENAKFCYECGKEVAFNGKINAQRSITFEGNIHKCPNCGEHINSFVSNCPACGHEIRNSQLPGSVVHEFSLKIEQIQSDVEKANLIRNFYIPNTKEDIIEFLILASSNMDIPGAVSEAWRAKLEQAYQKALLTFGDSSEFKYVETLYAKAKRKKTKKEKNNESATKLLEVFLNSSEETQKSIIAGLLIPIMLLFVLILNMRMLN